LILLHIHSCIPQPRFRPLEQIERKLLSRRGVKSLHQHKDLRNENIPASRRIVFASVDEPGSFIRKERENKSACG
jgi:hypothetical protein